MEEAKTATGLSYHLMNPDYYTSVLTCSLAYDSVIVINMSKIANLSPFPSPGKETKGEVCAKEGICSNH